MTQVARIKVRGEPGELYEAMLVEGEESFREDQTFQPVRRTNRMRLFFFFKESIVCGRWDVICNIVSLANDRS